MRTGGHMKIDRKTCRLLCALLLAMHTGLTGAEHLPGTAHTPLAIGANVQQLLQWADAHNPELAAMRYEIDAANERITPAGALPDPMLRVEFMDFAGPGAPDSFNPLPGQG